MLLICMAGTAVAADANAFATDGLVISVADAQADAVTAESGNFLVIENAAANAAANQLLKPGGYSFSWADSYTRKGISTGATGTPTYIGGADASAEAYGDYLAATGSVAYTEARRFTDPLFAIGIAHSGAYSLSEGAEAEAVGLGLAYNAQPNPNPGDPSTQEAGAFTYNFAYTTDPYAFAQSNSGAYDDVDLDPIVPNNAAYADAYATAWGDEVLAVTTTVATMVLGGDVEVECHDENLNPVMVTFEEGLSSSASGFALSMSDFEDDGNGNMVPTNIASATGQADAEAESGTIGTYTCNYAETYPWYSWAESASSAYNDQDHAAASAYGTAYGDETGAGVNTNAMVGSAEADAHSETYAIGSWDWSSVYSSAYASNTDDYAGSYGDAYAYGEDEYAESQANAMVGSAEADHHALSEASGFWDSDAGAYSTAYNDENSASSGANGWASGLLTEASSETYSEVGSGSTTGTASAEVFIGEANAGVYSSVWGGDDYAGSSASGSAVGFIAGTEATTTATLGSAATTGNAVSEALFGAVWAGSTSAAYDWDDYASASASGYAAGDYACTVVNTDAMVGSADASGTSTSMAMGEVYSEAGSSSSADVNGEVNDASASASASGDETYAETTTYADGDSSSASATAESSSENSGGN